MTATQAEIERRAIIALMFSLYPPSIRDALLQKKTFVTRFNIEVKKWVKLTGTDVSVPKTELHEIAVNLFEKPDATLTIIDRNSDQWNARLDVDDLGVVILEDDERVVRLPSLWMLLPDSKDRVSQLETIAISNGLSQPKLKTWSEILSKRRTNDDEVDLLFQDITNTVPCIEKNIEEEFSKEQGHVRNVVPIEIGYYENLVGPITPESSATEFLGKDYTNFLENYSHLNPSRRIEMALLSCWHSCSARAISEIECDINEMIGLIDRTAERGGACAIAGLAEVCLYKLENQPSLIDHLGKLIEPLLSKETEKYSLTLLSSMCMFIDAELGTSKSFQFTPPYYRRLAAFAHANLLERVFRELSFESPDYPEWSTSMADEFTKRNGSRYYFQNLCDMRLEPYWVPDHISPVSLKREFLGRIFSAANQVKEFIPEGELKSKLLDDVDNCLQAHLKTVLAFVAGPLEGEEDINSNIPPEIEKLAIKQLEKEPVDAASFIVTVNIANGLRPNVELAELAATKLEESQFYLKGFEDEDTLWAFINGMALLAAKTRCQKLSHFLQKFVSRMLGFKSMSIDVQQIVRSGLIAAAAFEDIKKWSEFLDEWLGRVAFSEMSKSQAIEMYKLLKTIVRYAPITNVNVAPSLAALDAFQKSQQ